MSFDYCFVGDKGDVTNQEEFDADGGAIKVLVVKDSRSSAIFGHVVPGKGIDDKRFAVDAIVANVKWLGYARVTLKSDNEPAILKLLSEALRDLRIEGLEQVLEENSPPYDPQANGSIEAGVKSLKGMLRTLRSS